MYNDTPTVIRYDASGDFIAIVVTVLGQGRLEACFHVYQIAHDGSGRTSLVKSSVWSSEQGAIAEFEAWEGR